MTDKTNAATSCVPTAPELPPEPTIWSAACGRVVELHHYDRLRAAAIRLREERDEQAESHRMQLAAISSAAFSNTKSTIKTRVNVPHAYWTPAYQHTCDAVDREMELRDQLTACLAVVDLVLAPHEATYRIMAPTLVKAARAAKDACK